MSKSYRRGQNIPGQFAWKLIEMLEAPAYRVLSRAGHQVLARIEIELAHHGGMDNGKLPVTYDQLVEYGMHRKAVAPAIREVVALGFVEITEHGRAGNAEFRRPSKYRLTYRYADRAKPTDEWRKITEQDAAAIAKTARAESTVSLRNGSGKSGKKNRNPGAESVPHVGGGKRTTNRAFHSTETAPTSHSTETAPTIDTFGVVAGDAAGASKLKH